MAQFGSCLNVFSGDRREVLFRMGVPIGELGTQSKEIITKSILKRGRLIISIGLDTMFNLGNVLCYFK